MCPLYRYPSSSSRAKELFSLIDEHKQGEISYLDFCSWVRGKVPVKQVLWYQ